MRKFIRTLWLCFGFLFMSNNYLTPNQTDGKLLNAIKYETNKTIALMHMFNVSILERENIRKYPAISPIEPTNIKRISSYYGERLHPIYHKKNIHTGIDLAANKGTPVISTGDGVVTSARWIGGYGKQVKIAHEGEYSTRYAHLSKILVKLDDTVNRGDTIGLVGSTGLSTGNHLHYEISHHNRTIDPLSIYPDTLQEKTYLGYLEEINNHYLSFSGNMSNILKSKKGEESTEPSKIDRTSTHDRGND